MNLESLKAGFMSYLAEKLEEEGKPVSPENLKASAASIFMNGDEFKEYLVQEYNADASIFSKSINEIMNMDFVNGELVESFDDGSSPKISNEDIAAFLEIMNDFNNTSFDINADESPLLGSQALESEAQNLFASDFEAAAQGETPAEQSFDSAPDVNGEAVPNEILPEVNSDIASEEVSGFESADVNSDGSAVDETNTAEGEIAGSEITEGEIAEGEITEGEITDGEITEGEITEGEITDEEITEGEITEGEITDEEIIDDEFSDGEIEEDALAEKLEEFYSNPDVLNALDYDKDGVLSDEEKSRFEDYVKNNYDETGKISEEDLDKILKEIEDGEFNYDNAPVENGEISTDEELKADDEAEDNKEVEKADETANAAPSTSPAAAGGSSGGGGVGGGGGISSG